MVLVLSLLLTMLWLLYVRAQYLAGFLCLLDVDTATGSSQERVENTAATKEAEGGGW
jgi:hypothetical protein